MLISKAEGMREKGNACQSHVCYTHPWWSEFLHGIHYSLCLQHSLLFWGFFKVNLDFHIDNALSYIIYFYNILLLYDLYC